MKHGLFQEDLETILQSDVSESLKHLVQANLIEKDSILGLYRVSPFIDYFVEMKINT